MFSNIFFKNLVLNFYSLNCPQNSKENNEFVTWGHHHWVGSRLLKFVRSYYIKIFHGFTYTETFNKWRKIIISPYLPSFKFRWKQRRHKTIIWQLYLTLIEVCIYLWVSVKPITSTSQNTRSMNETFQKRNTRAEKN